MRETTALHTNDHARYLRPIPRCSRLLRPVRRPIRRPACPQGATAPLLDHRPRRRGLSSGTDTADCCENGAVKLDAAGAPVSENADCSVEVPAVGPSAATAGDDSCAHANDGYCDEPYECDTGTDKTDCSQEGFENGNNKYCQYAGDGECDELNLCPAGSDTADCCLDGAPRGRDSAGFEVVAADVCCGADCEAPGPDWCQYANDGRCDEPPIGAECPVGTDTTDCLAAAEEMCLYADDGDCDEGPERKFCMPGTDFNDCCDAVGQVMVFGATYADGGSRPDAGRPVAGDADCSEDAFDRAGPRTVARIVYHTDETIANSIQTAQAAPAQGLSDGVTLPADSAVASPDSVLLLSGQRATWPNGATNEYSPLLLQLNGEYHVTGTVHLPVGTSLDPFPDYENQHGARIVHVHNDWEILLPGHADGSPAFYLTSTDHVPPTTGWDSCTGCGNAEFTLSHGADSCALANNGYCNEPSPCDRGTDTTDCSHKTPSGQRRPLFMMGALFMMCALFMMSAFFIGCPCCRTHSKHDDVAADSSDSAAAAVGPLVLATAVQIRSSKSDYLVPNPLHTDPESLVVTALVHADDTDEVKEPGPQPKPYMLICAGIIVLVYASQYYGLCLFTSKPEDLFIINL